MSLWWKRFFESVTRRRTDQANLLCVRPSSVVCFAGFAVSLILDDMMSNTQSDGEDATATASAAAASASGFDTDAVVCAACSQSSGPFSKRQLKKAQAGEPARK